MEPALIYAALFAAGLLGGFIAGLVGIGGGVVYVFIIPLALTLLGFPVQEHAQYTIANSLFAIVFASAAANYTLYRMGNFYPKYVIIVAVYAISTSLLMSEFVVNTPWFSMPVFNMILVALLLYMLTMTLLNAKKSYRYPLSKLKHFHFALAGMSGGVVAAVSGLGGGIAIIPVLNTAMKVDIKKASSISSGVIMLSSLMVVLYDLIKQPMIAYQHYSLGYIVFPIGLTLAAGVMVMSPIGVKTASRLSSKNISYIYSAFLGIVILRKTIELINYFGE